MELIFKIKLEAMCWAWVMWKDVETENMYLVLIEDIKNKVKVVG